MTTDLFQSRKTDGPWLLEDSDPSESGNPAGREQRLRSMSLSLSRRRPKSAMYAHDGLQVSPRTMDECAIEEGAEASGPWRNSSRSHSHGASGSIKGVFRRASLSLKGMIGRRPSMATDETIHEESQTSQRPTTANSAWHRLRQATSFRHSRSFHDFDLTQEPFQIPPVLLPPLICQSQARVMHRHSYRETLVQLPRQLLPCKTNILQLKANKTGYFMPLSVRTGMTVRVASVFQ